MAIPALAGILSRLQGVGNAAFAVQSLGGLKDSVNGLASAALKAANPLNQAGLAFKLSSEVFATGVDAAVAPLKVFAGSMATVRDAVASLGATTAEFVRLSEPMEVVHFNLAFRDATASIGRAILPLQQLGTAMVGAFRDVMWKLSGPIQTGLEKAFGPLTKLIPKMVDASAPLLRVFGELAVTFGEMFAALKIDKFIEGVLDPLQLSFELLEQTVLPLITATAQLAQIFGMMMADVFRWVGDAGKLLGLRAGTTTREKVSGGGVGAAVVQASLGSIDSYISKAWTNAFMMGTGGRKPEERTASGVEDIYNLLAGWPGEVAGWVADLPGKIAAAIRESVPGGETAHAAARGDAGGVARGLGGAPGAFVWDTHVKAARTLEKWGGDGLSWIERQFE